MEPLLFGAGGKLFIGMGDGGNNNVLPDPHGVAQDRNCLLGKILRISPYKSGTKPYTVPSDNPFVGVAGTRPEIWALGLRHPMNACFRDGTTGPVIFTDIGQKRIEEVNILSKGANYGWPLREGPFATSRGEPLGEPLIEQAPGSMVEPVACWDQRAEGDGSYGQAITGGFVSRSGSIAGLQGHYLCGDIVRGRAFHVPASALVPGRRAALRELTLLRQGQPVLLPTLCGTRRADLRFGCGLSGEVYIMTKQDGKIRRMRSV
jgi:hypothetical protein